MAERAKIASGEARLPRAGVKTRECVTASRYAKRYVDDFLPRPSQRQMANLPRILQPVA